MALPLLGSKWGSFIERALTSLGAESLSSPDAVAAMSELLDHVARWAGSVDLTAARTPEQLVDLYVADAAILAQHAIPGARDWVDVGAGGGAPGLSLTLLEPKATLTLVEPRSKRLAFLRTVGSVLAPGRTVAVRARSEVLDASNWDMAVSRATLPPAEWLREGARLARLGVWVLLARGEIPSLPGWEVAHDVSYALPFSGALRRAVCFVPGMGPGQCPAPEPSNHVRNVR
jgi:16S rRNA (guanine527-N7)-methyltransferase